MIHNLNSYPLTTVWTVIFINLTLAEKCNFFDLSLSYYSVFVLLGSPNFPVRMWPCALIGCTYPNNLELLAALEAEQLILTP